MWDIMGLGAPVRRCVVKLGSRLLVPDRQLDEAFVQALAAEVASLRRRSHEIVVVTSGAIATGLSLLGWSERPHSISRKQAVAAVGQIALMETYRRAFAAHGQSVAQILLTHEDFRDRKRFLNARRTLQTLIELGVVPLINENDTIASEEIRVGDNDNLAAMVACLWGADLLVLLSDIEGLYTADPRLDPTAEFVPVVEELDEKMEAFAEASTNPKGVGGMRTKLEAAKRAASFRIPTVIAQGREPSVLTRLLAGERIGTWISPRAGDRLQARKHWIGYIQNPQGTIRVDGGAERALTTEAKSLLPSGICSVEGDFQIGDVVALANRMGKPFGQGLTAYNAQEIRQIQGRRSADIEQILGYKYCDEIIHRDDLVIFEESRGNAR
jgi:glutamate 5-kinase